MTYTFKVWYQANRHADADEVQTECGLDVNQIEQATGAFLRDMETLKGRGCARFSVEVELT